MIIQNIKTKAYYIFNDDEMTITLLEPQKPSREYRNRQGLTVIRTTYKHIGESIPITQEDLELNYTAPELPTYE